MFLKCVSLTKWGLLSIAACIFLAAHWHVELTSDGVGYLNIADAIRSGAYWGAESEEQLRFGSTAIRTPTYPLLLAANGAAFGRSPSSVIILHLLLAVAAVGAVIRLVRNIKHTKSLWGYLCALLLSYFAMSTWFSAVLTEWTAFIGTIFLFVTVAFAHLRKSTFKWPLFSLLICSGLALLKPIFLLGVMPIVADLLTTSSRSKLTSCTLILMSFLVPIAIWATFNLYRLGEFTIVPFGAFNLFGYSCLAGNAPVLESDTLELKSFINFINEHKVPKTFTESAWLRSSALNDDLEIYDYNMWQLAYPFQRQHNLSWVEINSLAWTYAVRAISGNLSNFFYLICFSLSQALSALILIFAIVALSLIKPYRSQSFPYAARLIAFMQLILVTQMAALHGFLQRYNDMSLGCLIFVGLALIIYISAQSSSSSAQIDYSMK